VADALGALIEMYEDLGKKLPPVLKPLSALPGELIWAETLVLAGAA
jgi:hypothetical protein